MTFSTLFKHLWLPTRVILLFLLFISSKINGAELPNPQSTLWQQWLALIHFHSGDYTIKDRRFLLSHQQPSPSQEWIETISLFKSDDTSICRFPARYRLISAFLNEGQLPAFPHCPDLEIYQQQVPSDKISIVYASENLASPTSMMGHAMLSIEGTREDDFFARHSVSFFAELNNYNPLDIIWTNLVTGNEGFLLVKPLGEHYEFYNVEEQRNVWVYGLDLTKEQRLLIRDHIWELRHPRHTYFFHTNNCATLISDILKVAYPKVSRTGWVSPIDLVKLYNTAGHVSETELLPSPKWLIRMLLEIVDSRSIASVNSWLNGTKGWHPQNNDVGFLEWQLADAIRELRFQTQSINVESNNQLKEKLAALKPSNSYELDLQTYKSPVLTPDDSQVSIGITHRFDKNLLRFDWLPAAHGIEDDNQHYFSENELKIFEISILANPDTKDIELDKFLLYSAKTLNPRDSLTGGISGEFNLGYLTRLLPEERTNRQFELSGGAGITKAIGPDFRWYGLLSGGLALTGRHEGFFLEPEFGAYLYEVGHMKTWLRYSPWVNTDEEIIHRTSLTHTLNFDNHALIFNIDKAWGDKQSAMQWSILFKHYY